jgi:hypothetical protein|tara:strand:+ start:56302 stop:57048 length:747 start_codon:yes stop_codon:yes gene_type:complete
MEKVFIAYFDLLGFKQFLLNNTEYVLSYRSGHILRDIENALSQGAMKPRRPGEVIADRKDNNINCLNVSDTVIFYTKDSSKESFEEFMKVIFRFNWTMNFHNFPVRGYATYDNFELIHGQDLNDNNAYYSVNLMYGKGLYKSHDKTDLQDWAGCAIDSSIESKVENEFGGDKSVIWKYAKKYDVPYKNHTIFQYALKFSETEISEEFFQSKKEGLIRAFKNDYKSITDGVQRKLDNTLRFLKTHIEAK